MAVIAKKPGNVRRYERKTADKLAVRRDYVNWGGMDCPVLDVQPSGSKYAVKLAGRDYTTMLTVKATDMFYVRPDDVTDDTDDTPKKRGRPKGSKNKKSLTAS